MQETGPPQPQGTASLGASFVRRQRERRRQDSGHCRGQWGLAPEEAAQREHVDGCERFGAQLRGQVPVPITKTVSRQFKSIPGSCL